MTSSATKITYKKNFNSALRMVKKGSEITRKIPHLLAFVAMMMSQSKMASLLKNVGIRCVENASKNS